MLSTSEFAEWSKKVVLFLHNTSQVDGEPYPSLLFEKGGNGFPTVSYLDASGALLKQVGHVTPVADLEKAWQDLQAWQKLRAAVEGGDKSKEQELFLLELEMGNRPFAEMQARSEKVSIDGAAKAKVAQQLVNLEFNEILRATPRDQMAAGGAKFAAMYRGKRLPTGSPSETSFWLYLFAHAEASGDVTLFEDALTHLKATKADDRRLARYLPQLEEQLAQLKAKGDKKDG